VETFEITGFITGQDNEGVNFLQPSDSFQKVENGFVHRQVLQSRPGFTNFGDRLAGGTRVTGIFEFTRPGGTKDLLVTDMNFLYKYNTSTNVFDQISFAGSLAGYAGFAIGDNESYISGTGYPDKDNAARFIICGTGIAAAGSGSSIFFYDGTNVLDYTNVTDNPEYTHPVEGNLTRAKYVKYFNERLNFIVPTITTARNQGMAFSGIRTSGGSGDKFAVAGSGLFQFSTEQLIKGVEILGPEMVFNFEGGARVLQITTDAFNPYIPRNLPSFIGTDASFSSVGWGDFIATVGKEGILKTDARQSLRIDTKLPDFTADVIDQPKFELTYGGFDRKNGQFLWSYLDTSTTDTTQNRVLVWNYEEDSWSVYNMRFSVFGESEIGQDLVWNQIDVSTSHPTWGRWDTTEETWNKIGLGASIKKVLAGDDLGFIYELNSGFDDHTTGITAITKAANAVLTVNASGIVAGDEVVISNAGGMVEINNFDPSDLAQVNFKTYTVVSATPTSITINVDSSLFTTYTSGGTISVPINFRAETIPLNPYRAHGRRFNVSEIEILIDTLGGSVKVDVFEDEKVSPFIQDKILNPTKTGQTREWITMSVNHEANFLTFVFKQTSPSVQLKIISVRIHGEPGGPTSG
tara:strand:- start:7009 stop:8910 length:1902 start_codon:yes stop_codon:yes gene_type:complete